MFDFPLTFCIYAATSLLVTTLPQVLCCPQLGNTVSEGLSWDAVTLSFVTGDSRDANLWRPKIVRLSPPPEFQRPSPRKLDPFPNGNDLRHYMTSYMMLILSKFEIFVND